MPANTFGPGDNSDPEWSHVIAGFTGRAHKAKMQNKPSVVIWGLGKPIREFNSSDDLAEGSIFLLSNLSQSSEEIFPTDSLPIINVGVGRGISVGDFAHQVRKTVGFTGDLNYDITYPDGPTEKVLDVRKMSLLSWAGPKTTLQTGLVSACRDYPQGLGCD
jgi:GDP-L-fucose synthase